MTQKNGIRELILRAFKDQKELSSEEIFKKVSKAGYSTHGIRCLTHRLTSEGKLRRVCRATYRLAAAPASDGRQKIVRAVLKIKGEFTSKDVVKASGASPRHARRTLGELTKSKVLARKGTIYSVKNRVGLRKAA